MCRDWAPGEVVGIEELNEEEMGEEGRDVLHLGLHLPGVKGQGPWGPGRGGRLVAGLGVGFF